MLLAYNEGSLQGFVYYYARFMPFDPLWDKYTILPTG